MTDVTPTFDTAMFLAQTRARGNLYGQPLVYMASTGSTNDDALAAARDGASEGTTFVCDEQRTGRGRSGREWSSYPGRDLTFSVVLRPRLAPEHLSLVTLAAGLACFHALAELLPSLPRELGIKWPNDLLLSGKKLAGVLVESQGAGTRLPAVVIGIGLNMGERVFAASLAHRATSLALAGLPLPPREALMVATLHHLQRWMHALCAGHVEDLVSALGERDALRGRNLLLDGKPALGCGIDHKGNLLVQDAAGQRAVYSGTVELSEWITHQD